MPKKEYNIYCNKCGWSTPRESEDGECPYHQRVIIDEEGTHLKYEEFDQNGEGY